MSEFAVRKTEFVRKGPILIPRDATAGSVMPRLPAATFSVGHNPDIGFFLTHMESFSDLGKIYGDASSRADRIMNTFRDRDVSTGVLLAGEKGSGKTMLAKMLSQRGLALDMPTIIVSAPYVGDGFMQFIQQIEQECIIIFDEFEKVYDRDHQPFILTLLDGLYPSKKLFVLTCNDVYKIDSHMHNRPGRLLYFLEFKGISREFIVEYCADRLNDKTGVDGILAVSMSIPTFNFDMLKALVEEMNRYNESAQQCVGMLNIKVDAYSNDMYDVVVKDGDAVLDKCNDTPAKYHGNPFRDECISVEVDDPSVSNKGKSDDEFDSSSLYFTFTSDDLIKVDPVQGTFFYRSSEGQLLQLKRVPRQDRRQFSYLDAV